MQHSLLLCAYGAHTCYDAARSARCREHASVVSARARLLLLFQRSPGCGLLHLGSRFVVRACPPPPPQPWHLPLSRAAELASDVAAAVPAVELQKPLPQAPLLSPLVLGCFCCFTAVVPFTSAAASWCALALPLLHPSQHLSFSFCKEKYPKTGNSLRKMIASAQRVTKREKRRWCRSKRIC